MTSLIYSKCTESTARKHHNSHILIEYCSVKSIDLTKAEFYFLGFEFIQKTYDQASLILILILEKESETISVDDVSDIFKMYGVDYKDVCIK